MFRNKSWMLAAVFGFVASGATASADNGVIKGKAIFGGNVDQHKPTRIKTDKDPNCKLSKEKIGTYNVRLNKKMDPVTVRNVLVFIKEKPAGKTYKAPTEVKTLTQFGCEYQPHVFGIMDGQGLQILNGDNTNHNIHFLPKVNQEFNFSQPKKDTEKGRTITLTKEGVFKIKCDVHPWMAAYAQVFDHPFYTVTGSFFQGA